MVRSPKITDSIQPRTAERHHTDSPKLWVGVATGSIVFHLLLFSIVPLSARLLPQQKETILVPIELIDANPAGSSQSAPVDTSVAPAPPEQSDLAPQVSTTNPLPNPVPEFAPALGDRAIVPNSRFQNMPTPVPEAQPSIPSDLDETADPSSEIPPDTQVTNSPPPTSARPRTAPTPPINPPNSNASALPLPPEEDDPLPNVAVNHEVRPTGFAASLRVEAVSESETNEFPDQMAYPRENTQSFVDDPRTSNCRVDPEAASFLGNEVAFRVTVDETGKVTHTQPRGVGRIPLAYYELAACLLRDWEFEPAIVGGAPFLSDSLVVYVRIEER